MTKLELSLQPYEETTELDVIEAWTEIHDND